MVSAKVVFQVLDSVLLLTVTAFVEESYRRKSLSSGHDIRYLISHAIAKDCV